MVHAAVTRGPLRSRVGGVPPIGVVPWSPSIGAPPLSAGMSLRWGLLSPMDPWFLVGGGLGLRLPPGLARVGSLPPPTLRAGLQFAGDGYGPCRDEDCHVVVAARDPPLSGAASIRGGSLENGIGVVGSLAPIGGLFNMYRSL